MKIKLLFLAILIFTCIDNTYAQIPKWEWAKSAGGTNLDDINLSVIDKMGNLYVAGDYGTPSITFGSYTLPAAKTASIDVFLVKYDSSGNVLWAKHDSVGSTGYPGESAVTGLTTDALGNIYVAGNFMAPTITFDTVTLRSTNNEHGAVFLVKYDGNGKVLWAKTGTNHNSLDNSGGGRVLTDKNNNAYITGFFIDSITFAPYKLAGSKKLSSGYYNIFIAKYNENGNVMWAKCIGGDGEDVASIAIDNQANLDIWGTSTSKYLAFGTDTIRANMLNNKPGDLFLAKLDSNGNSIWARNAGGNYQDGTNVLATDMAGNVFITGGFSGPYLLIGTDSLVNDSSSLNELFLAKYDANGSFLWAKKGIGSSFDNLESIAVDNNGSIYACGSFQGPTLALDTFTLRKDASISNGAFFAKYDANGNVEWLTGAGGRSFKVAWAVACDNNAVYFCGSYGNNGDKEIVFDRDTLEESSTGDLFIAKIYVANDLTAVNNIHPSNTLSLFPNPCSTCYITGIDNPADLIITDLLGRSVKPAFIKSSGGYSIQMQQYANGIYILHDIKTGESKKFVKE